ncbi:MAG: glycosyltransferase family 4 protein [Pseudomonadota bacterium]
MSARLHVCLLASEFFGLGIAGGFGFATRSLGRQLVAAGHRVSVVIPRPRHVDGMAVEIDGIQVFTYPRSKVFLHDALFVKLGADVYHSQEPSLSTYVAQRAAPHAVHVVTSRDPRTFRDWCIEFAYPSHTRIGLLRTAAFYENPFTRRAVRAADRVFVPARCLAVKVKKKYGLVHPPSFMPTPVALPERPEIKASQPTVCYVGRLDRRKRPDRFFDLAAQFPSIDFLVAGSAQDPRYAAWLKQRYADTPNLKMLGFVDQFASRALADVFARAWIMVNSAAREGLPNVFIEAAAHGCAIVSPHNPDEFASRFGRHCPDGDFAGAVQSLLCNDEWYRCGQAGAAYVARTNSLPLATAAHESAYRELLNAQCVG